ncbi:N-acetylmuramoyl-L-alanine amidase [Laribacter hongkongensis]|uniref:N-acetylmuramoyl-L-alanine amidase n=1 Tax=Laribacter hongkongensis TaxID=168471 RepID=A0ABD4STR0_9NEIS|nr:N-acetylmuramoyl-L-alanine amidase [Laribacter hongkongensis]MCG8993715.1 N-acetylmuramoyl-L-alanine amidase [Laribacter hongkongensis]MCG9001840.1 N-acetylmuramoyl-L-alanine amidase [Laribacter hongkongensis]MCG9008152.1 N-acetylmuramoyl-L-alanine amidase [Laribacter hongkongensis]MCG9017883.1 N-acetylmuramoyl-L-alanine amidase [Laribacter hongkongensis]MCG9026508.1 N-acetylmuramoyl-L-alanine amidase [Laribacter hongkongensis]
MSRTISLIVIHCAATPNGKPLGKGGNKTAAATIDVWHSARGFRRNDAARQACNPALYSIGYHYVIDTDGRKETGRGLDEIGAHAAGHNKNSIGICMVGTDRFTRAQFDALGALVRALKARYPAARICGHRDLSPDLNGDGVIQPREWTKTCPGFTVADWLDAGMQPLAGHLVG